MNSQLSTSYSTSYALRGLSRLYLALLGADLSIATIITGVELVVFTQSCTVKISEVRRLWRLSAVVVSDAGQHFL